MTEIIWFLNIRVRHSNTDSKWVVSSNGADFFHKHFFGRKTQKVFLKNSNLFRMTSPVIDSNLTGIRLEADMTETKVNKAAEASRQSGEGIVFWRCPTQN